MVAANISGERTSRSLKIPQAPGLMKVLYDCRVFTLGYRNNVYNHQTVPGIFCLKRSLGQTLSSGFLLLQSLLVSFTVAICEHVLVTPHKERVFHKLLFAMNDSIAV